ncbi:MAG: DNA-binding protein WhiA [Clostridia bacterium]|nr:DNA-binding protein WhiA [Clostridia bacterium]
MSFSSDVKQELTAIKDIPSCCLHAMTYGMLLFGRAFNSRNISIMTEHECVAQMYCSLINKDIGVSVKINQSSAGKYSINIENKETINKILSSFSVNGNESVTRINRGNLLNEHEDDSLEILNCCNSAFLRGAFLSCGTITDPNKGYHLEFVVPFKILSMDLMKILTEYGISAKHMLRRGVNVIYIKESESIEDLLNIIGAKLSAFEIMNIKIYKDIRNTVNRQTNFSFANISRTAGAACKQIDEIEKLKEKGWFSRLDEDLQSFAELRIENPEASLRELGEMCDPPISRSAVNHKLKKISNFLQQCLAGNIE